MAGKNNDFLKTLGTVLGVLVVVITLLTVLLINPVNERACEAKTRAEKNSESISDIRVDMGKLETKTDNVDKNLERLMRAVDVPPVTDVPPGRYSADASKETK